MPRRRPCRGCPRDRRRGRRRPWRAGTAPAPCPARGRGSPAAPRRARAARLRGRGGRDLEVRAALESLAARHAAARATPADVRELRALLRDMGARRERGDLMAVSETNARLHRRILEISGQATARRLSGMLISQIVRFQYRTVLLPGRPERSHREHTAIVDAIAAGDGDAAERATRRHLDHVARALHARVSAAAQPAPASAAGRRRRS
ncbi:MAG TPA: FCD domain-containing protein [Solirubrobacteraceae bacterium]|nr:FCD domain-containing protein [Solirubrobacteraceae bacterium]